MNIDRKDIFESERPGRALAIMAVPSIISQMIVLAFNLADTWFIGRTNDPNMVGASSLALTVYLALVAMSNIFGVGGGTLMSRLIGEKNEDDARKVASYSVAVSSISAAVFSVLIFLFLKPLVIFLGADEITMVYMQQYILMTVVLGGVPTVLTMCMSQLTRNAGFSKEAGFGVGVGSVLNIILDPVFMFLLLPQGKEVLGAGIATLISNVVSAVYFIAVFIRLKDKTVLSIPRKIEHISGVHKKSLYAVGIPAALAIFLFDVVNIVLNKLTVSYGNIPLAAMGIVLKLERIPTYIGIGICLGMVPLVAYNYGAGNFARMKTISRIARRVIIIMSVVCIAFILVFDEFVMGRFIDDPETIRYGAIFIQGRCLALPLMVIGNHTVYFMNAVGKGKISLLLGVVRHLVLIIPILLIMNSLWGLTGLVWSQLVADVINVIFALIVYRKAEKKIERTLAERVA